MSSDKIYFPNLNGLRFIAAALVIIHHTEQIKAVSNMENYWLKIPFINVVGHLGVVLFFVLSGFLITYLLLAEEHQFSSISIKKFYFRRILRIWPLYFLVISLAFFVFPHFSFFEFPGVGKDLIYKDIYLKLLLYIFFLSNLVLALLYVVPYAAHTWSIGTEEQFYLIWPVVINYFKKNRILVMFIIILFYVLVKLFLNSHFSNILPFKGTIREFWSSFSIDCMAIGGIFGIVLFRRMRILFFLQNNYFFYITFVLSIALISFGFELNEFQNEFYSILFGIIILNLASNDRIIISLENRIFIYLGNISYGLYMFHPVGIKISLFLAIYFGVVSNWLIYPVSIGITILISGFSYKFFESFFLRYKYKFSNVISGSQS